MKYKMNIKSMNILKSLFKQYYGRNISRVFVPKNFANREFAFQFFDKQGMVRHLGFEKVEEIQNYISKNIPRHAYYSTAIYVLPSASDMDEKGWLGAELVFDIDADHLNTPCKYEHDRWKCLNCGFEETGPPLDKCPNCGSQNIEKFAWVCKKCIDAAKNELIKLIEEFLIPDLGFKISDMLIVFSGHRGFHLHIQCEECLKLSSEERREIVDYVKALGLKVELLIPKYKRKGEIVGVDLREKGWRGKIARKIFEKISLPDETVKNIVGSKAFTKLVENSEKIIKEMSEPLPKWTTLYRSLGPKNVLKLANAVINEIKCSVDEKVTIDTHRLIRLPNSLHGKTGLPVTILKSVDDLEKFELKPELSPFKGEALVRLVENIPLNLKLFGENVGGKKGTKLKLSLPTAIYLVARGIAEFEEIIK